MPAKFLTLSLGGLLAAAAVWASVPDSTLQNHTVDVWRVKTAHGRLVSVSDNQPVANRYQVVAVLGLNDDQNIDGPPEAELQRIVGKSLAETETKYRLWTGAEFKDDVKVYGAWYNSSYSPQQIAKWLRALLEANPEFTGGATKFSVWVLSMGGDVMFCYWVDTNGKKLDVEVTFGTPHNGALFADDQATKAAFEKGFPKWLSQIAQGAAAKRRIDFNAPGTQWLRLGYPELERLRLQHPLDRSWVLVAGRITPSGAGFGKYVDALMTVDSLWLEDGTNMDQTAYRLGAYVIQSSGIATFSDGVVTDTSAWCQGFAGEATTVLLQDHNHSQVWWGNGTFDVAEARLRPIMPYILAKKSQAKPKETKGFDLWLPPTDIALDLPKPDLDRLKSARLVWVDANERLVVADESGNNPTILNVAGRFSWPQWLGDDLVVTYHHGGGSDVMLIAANGETKLLTTDGTSGPAGVSEDGLVAWVSSGQVVVWRQAEAIAKVVATGASVDTPPVIYGGRVYLAVKAATGYELRSVQLASQGQSIQAAKLEEAGITRPMKVGAALLALKSTGDEARLVVVSQWWSGTLDRPIQNLLKLQGQENVPAISLVDFDDQSGAVYLICGGHQISQLNTGLVLQSFTRLVEVDDWTTVASPIATGMQLDVK